jgi:signal transduction histidine kinase
MKKNEILLKVRQFEKFAPVPDPQIEWLIERSEVRHFDDGDMIFMPNQAIEDTFIVISGGYRVYVVHTNGEEELSRFEAGDISGFLPFSRGKFFTALGRATGDSVLLFFSKKYERELIGNHYELAQCFVHQLTNRVRHFTSLQLQTEKLAALGKLSAGLAHELNNPAAAITRSSLALKEQMRLKPEKFKRVIKARLSDEVTDKINSLLFSKIAGPATSMTLLQRKSLEDEFIDMLEQHGIDDVEGLAEQLVDFNFSTLEIQQEIIDLLRPEDVTLVLEWIGDNLLMEKTVSDIHDASERIARLVKSVKVYTHMDQSHEKTVASLESGIQNTIQMLGYKLKNNGVKVSAHFAENPREFPIHISEMNQLWTNLIDNAIDAMDNVQFPHLTIETAYNDREANVRITDNGKGIPEEAMNRIWEPFYTTKEVGKGTGLGLEVCRNIVEKHGGKITVKSSAGETTFIVCLPFNTPIK